MAVSLATGLKSLFFALGCLITATVVYTIVTDGLPFRKELLTPWMAATLIDFYVNILPIGAWIFYKEVWWISKIFWIVLLVCLGSITTCFFIVLQFLKMSRKESLKDPIYFLLVRPKSKKGDEMNIFSVMTARVLFSALGCLMLGTLIYTIIRAGSPFHKDVLFPWLSATLIDFYVSVVPLLVWVAYKESSWILSAVWIILFICFGSICTSAYLVLQLFRLCTDDPVYLILFNSNDMLENGYESTVEKDSSVAG